MKEAEGSEEYAALVGIDWGDKKHDVCLRAAGSERTEHWVVQHTPEELAGWASRVRERFRGKKVAVCVELARGPIVSALLQHDFIEIYPVNPQTLARYRDAWHPSGAKDDPTDAKLALEVLQKHRDKLKRLKPQSAEMRALRRLVEDRRRLVQDRVRVTNRITAALKAYFPQVLEWFEDKGTVVFCDFVERWTSATSARRARAATLRDFFTAHNVRHRSVVDGRIKAIKEAQPLTTDPGVVTPATLLVKSLLPQLKALLEAIKAYDAEILATCQKLPDFRVFESFPSASTVFAPRLLAAFGEDRSAFKTASEVQRYGGIAPVTERSGNQKWVHWRFKASRFQRQTFVEWAGLTVPKSFWAGEYYRQQRARGASHQTALRALAFKWARILFRCWKEGQPYDESRYLKALRKRGSTLLSQAEKSAAQT